MSHAVMCLACAVRTETYLYWGDGILRVNERMVISQQ